jgi:subtilisin family serine protease
VAGGVVKRAAAAYRHLQPLNDFTAEETGAAEARGWDPPLRGAGERVAVLDSGFELDLEDLPDPAAAMDYADYPDTNADVRDRVVGHGTHVAGTIFGSGALSGGVWQGMAPEAEPIYLKIGDDSSGEASTAAVVAAVRASATWCNADIGTMSYGGFDGFNDGSSAEEQAVDWAVEQGVTYFMSAGNSAEARDHWSGELAPGDTAEPVQIVIRFAGSPVTWQMYLSWYDGADTSAHTMMEAVVMDGEGDTLECDAPGQISSPRGTEMRQYLPPESPAGDIMAYFAVVVNRSNRAQVYHLRLESSHWFCRFTQTDSRTTVALPSTADRCLSVGAYTSRTSWTNYRGEFYDDRTARGAIADISSHGPRIDIVAIHVEDVSQRRRQHDGD